MKIKTHERTRAQESSNAIERMYITMRHLFNRGFYKPMGVSGETLRNALLQLRPEIYGTIAEEKGELSGLIYVLERLMYFSVISLDIQCSCGIEIVLWQAQLWGFATPSLRVALGALSLFA